MVRKSLVSDEELIVRMKEGQEAAFTELYHRYWKVLLIKAFDRLQSEDDAEEIIQDVFTNLWKKRETLELKYTFRTYINSVLKYEIWNRITQQTRQNGFTDLEEIDRATEYTLSESSLVSELELKELQTQLDEIIDTLPTQCRLIFRLSRDEEMTAREIAESLNISPRTVETQISKALKVIRNSLTKVMVFMLLELVLLLSAGGGLEVFYRYS